VAGVQVGGDHVTQAGVLQEETAVYVTESMESSESIEERVERILVLVKNQDEY
jgi:hypothetical protein